AVRSCYIEQYGLHPGASRAKIIDGVNVSNVQTLLRPRAQFSQCRLKYSRMRLLMPDHPGIHNAEETIGYAADPKRVAYLAVGVGNHPNPISFPNLLERVAGAGTDTVPVDG